MFAVPVGAEPEKRDVTDVDPERPALSVIEDERAVIPATHRRQTGQKFVEGTYDRWAYLPEKRDARTAWP
jgi:hypothetical protein